MYSFPSFTACMYCLRLVCVLIFSLPAWRLVFICAGFSPAFSRFSIASISRNARAYACFGFSRETSAEAMM